MYGLSTGESRVGLTATETFAERIRHDERLKLENKVSGGYTRICRCK